MEVRILAIGDVVAQSGLELVSRKLRSIKKLTGADFIVVNGENAAGVGITARQAEEIMDAGADAVTLGNHAFQKEDIFNLLDDAPWLLRPHNYAPQAPGFGWRVLEAPFGPVLLMNLIGRCDMDFGPDNPFAAADRILREGESAVRDYKRFLSAGCSVPPIEALRYAGVDMEMPNAVKNAMQVFTQTVEDLKKLI